MLTKIRLEPFYMFIKTYQKLCSQLPRSQWETENIPRSKNKTDQLLTKETTKVYTKIKTKKCSYRSLQEDNVECHGQCPWKFLYRIHNNEFPGERYKAVASQLVTRESRQQEVAMTLDQFKKYAGQIIQLLQKEHIFFSNLQLVFNQFQDVR